MGIFDTTLLAVRANNLLALARQEHAKGQIAFAEQLRAQARKYFKELGAMGDGSADSSHNSKKESSPVLRPDE
jgi:hypothetical protein